MRAFTYCRVSTREQSSEDHYSLDNQEQRCRDYIKMKKWQVLKVRKDVASGKNDERVGFQELLASIREKKTDVVVVYRLDRLSRNVRDIYEFLDLIKNSGVGFVSVTEGFDTTTAMGRAMLGVAAVFAQLTREMIGENTRDGLMRRAEAGLYTGNPTRLYGYNYCPERGIKIDPEEAPHVRQIFDWYTEDKWGAEKIARSLNLRGTPSKTGVQWTDNTVAHIIRNKTYRGLVQANGQDVPGQHEAIVPQEQFAAAQELIRSRATTPSRRHSSPHLLSGIASCGKCGKKLAIHTIYQGGDKKPIHFYRHHASERVGPDACEGLTKSARLLETVVVDQIRQLAESRQIEKLVLKDVQRHRGKQQAPAVKERDQILMQLEELGEKFSHWADRLDDGRIDEQQFDRQNLRLLARKKTLQERLEVLQGELVEGQQLEVTLDEVRKVLSDFPAVWDALELEERREVLRLLIEELKVFKTHGEMKVLFLDAVEMPLRPINNRIL